MKTVEVCFTPALLNKYTLEDKLVVVVDILRATTMITTMFKNGLNKLIPVTDLNEAKKYKEKGFLVAAERNGEKIDFADFSNSPYVFTEENIKGKRWFIAQRMEPIQFMLPTRQNKLLLPHSSIYRP